MSGNIILAIVLGSPILAYLLGSYIGRSLRMKDHGWKIGFILASITLGTCVTVFYWPPKLGIALSGGVILVYELDEARTSSEAATQASVDGDPLQTGARLRLGDETLIELPESGVGQTLRYAVRVLRTSPHLLIVSVLSVGLGIGLVTAGFGMVYRLLLAPPPVAEPAEHPHFRDRRRLEGARGLLCEGRHLNAPSAGRACCKRSSTRKWSG